MIFYFSSIIFNLYFFFSIRDFKFFIHSFKSTQIIIFNSLSSRYCFCQNCQKIASFESKLKHDVGYGPSTIPLFSKPQTSKGATIQVYFGNW